MYTCCFCGFTGCYDNIKDDISSLEGSDFRRKVSLSLKDNKKLNLNYEMISDIFICNNYIIFKCGREIVVTNIDGEEIWKKSLPIAFCISNSDATILFVTKTESSYSFEELYLEDGSVKETFVTSKPLDFRTDCKILLSIGKTFSLITNGLKLYKFIFSLSSSTCDVIDIEVPTKSSIVSVSCGHAHAVVLTSDNTVFTIGSGARGQLGNGLTSTTHELVKLDILHPLKIIYVKAGGWHNIALADTGDLYGWGWNECGQVGVAQHPLQDQGKTEDSSHETSASNNNFPTLVFLPTLLNTPLDIEFQSVAVGSRHSVAVTNDGNLFTWGWHGYQQLFLDDTEKIYEPRKVNFGDDYYVEYAYCGCWSTLMFCKK